MIVDIPNIRMRQKLTRLLSDIPGKFSYHPRRVSGLDQLVAFRNNGISCPEFTVHLEDARKSVEAGYNVFGRNRNHEKGADIVIHKLFQSRTGTPSNAAVQRLPRPL